LHGVTAPIMTMLYTACAAPVPEGFRNLNLCYIVYCKL